MGLTETAPLQVSPGHRSSLGKQQVTVGDPLLHLQAPFPIPTTPSSHRHRVIQPMGMSPRGQLTSLQDAMCETMEGQLSSDPDSDPD